MVLIPAHEAVALRNLRITLHEDVGLQCGCVFPLRSMDLK